MVGLVDPIHVALDFYVDCWPCLLVLEWSCYWQVKRWVRARSVEDFKERDHGLILKDGRDGACVKLMF
jgi:hypothetical protein